MLFDPKYYPRVDFDNPDPNIREDLRLVRTAEKMGYVVEDLRPGAGEPLQFKFHRNPPNLCCVVWKSGWKWACADFENGWYSHHRYYPGLLEALTSEKG